MPKNNSDIKPNRKPEIRENYSNNRPTAGIKPSKPLPKPVPKPIKDSVN